MPVSSVGATTAGSGFGAGAGGVGATTTGVDGASINDTWTTSGPGTMSVAGGRTTNSTASSNRCTAPEAITELRTRSVSPPRRWLGHEAERRHARAAQPGDQLDDEPIGDALVRL